MAEYVPWGGINPPGLVTQDVFTGPEVSEESLEATDKIEPFVPEEIWSGFTYTKDENKFMSSTGSDIEKYIDEMRDKFITGYETLDDEAWEKYLETIESMGLEEYMNVQNSAYERYNSQ